jgi:hypothetical protein
MTSTASLTSAEVKKIITDMKKVARKSARSVESAKAFLASTGVYTKKGNLKKAYK